VQIVSSAAIVINFERALQCIDEVVQPDKSIRYIFTKPLPTMCGLLCHSCRVCQICGEPTEEEVRCDGAIVRACLGCTDACVECGQGKVRHHSCCVVLSGHSS
jgi:hypothetical protein